MCERWNGRWKADVRLLPRFPRVASNATSELVKCVVYSVQTPPDVGAHMTKKVPLGTHGSLENGSCAPETIFVGRESAPDLRSVCATTAGCAPSRPRRPQRAESVDDVRSARNFDPAERQRSAVYGQQ